MTRIFAVALLFAALTLTAGPAFAQKASNVTQIQGEAYVVRCDPTSDWLAAWTKQPDGLYKLFVINGDNGDVQAVTTSASKDGLWSNPGGMCWIPNRETLLFTYGVYNKTVKDYKVYYYTWDPKKKESDRIGTVTDKLETFQFDPIPADDGSRVFHMIIGTNKLPMFITYLPESEVLTPREAVSQLNTPANITSEYDLSADGSLVYWPLHDPGTGDYVIVAWDLSPDYWVYREAYTYGASKDPADEHAGIKVDTRHMQAAAFTYSEKDPTLKMCIYNFEDTGNLYIVPIHMGATEEIQDFEWKGSANTLFMLIWNSASNRYSIEEIDPLMGNRRTLYSSDSDISYVDYSVTAKTYYFTEVENAGSSKARTRIRRLR